MRWWPGYQLKYLNIESLVRLSTLNKKLFLKVLISSALIIWILIYKVDWVKLSIIIGSLKLNWLILAFLMHFSGLYFSALRWKQLLKGQNININLLPLCESYLICTFFNLFMPTRIGGDAIRIHHLNQEIKSIPKSASSIFLERLIGISVLCVFAFVSSLIGIISGHVLQSAWIGLFTGLCGIFSLFVLVYTNIVSNVISWLPLKKQKYIMDKGLKDFIANIRLIFSDSKSVIYGIIISIFLQVNVIIHFWFIGKALSLDVPLIDYFFLIPVQLFILMLPSINGIGLREASSIALFNFYGINSTTAALFGFIDLTMMILIGIVGWLCFLRKGKLIPKLD